MNNHPHLPGVLLGEEQLSDRTERWSAHSREIYAQPFLQLREDTVSSPHGETFNRVVVQHQGAVGIVALDDDGQVLVLDQYRHPVGKRLIELPAGVLDVEGEQPLETARRELREEADLEAEDWKPILQMYATPGCSDEHWQVFLATGLSPTPPKQRVRREDEEADMRQLWVRLDDLVEAALAGRIGDSMTVAGALAVQNLLGRS